MFTAQLQPSGPWAIRYPRSRGVMPEWKTPFEKVEIGKGQMLREGKDLAFISLGHIGNTVLDACARLDANGINAGAFDMRFLKPIDEELLHAIFRKYDKIITVEDGTILGGLGSAVIEFANQNKYRGTIVRLGVPDRFIEQGTLEELHHECGFDLDGMVKAANDLMAL
jgi:1-deoxy-D-xylulose-5-phosphate synthase